MLVVDIPIKDNHHAPTVSSAERLINLVCFIYMLRVAIQNLFIVIIAVTYINVLNRKTHEMTLKKSCHELAIRY